MHYWSFRRPTGQWATTNKAVKRWMPGHLSVAASESTEVYSFCLGTVRVQYEDSCQKCFDLCRAYCTRSHNAAVISSDEERVIWIPGRLLVAASRDTEVYSFILDTVFRNGLFPAKLPTEAAARQWAVMYTSCGEQERSAIVAVLRAKARAQQDTQSFLAIRGGQLGNVVAVIVTHT